MSRYGFDSRSATGRRCRTALEPRLVELHIDKAAIDSAYRELTGGLSDLDRETLARMACRCWSRCRERIDRICADIAADFLRRLRPQRFQWHGRHL